jgi:hypothetical protein
MLSSTSPPFETLSLDDLTLAGASDTDWLWQGYLAPGNITLMSSQWKTGKTTLLSVLLDRMKNGGSLLGMPVRQGRAVVVSEEDRQLWKERSRRFDFAGHVCWMCRPFIVRPGMAEWENLVEHLLGLHQQRGASLAVIDSLAEFFPARSETHASPMLAALLPLRRLTAAGMAVLVLHHTRKKGGMDGQCARGSGALCSFVDILLELHWYDRAASEDRRRRLLGWSRHAETPRHRIIELNADGRDYVNLGDVEQEALRPVQQTLCEVLKQARKKLTSAEILAAWPPEHPKPSAATLWRVLTSAVERGELKRDGEGVRTDPFYYWAPSLEEYWKSDAMARLIQDNADNARKLSRQFPGMKFH